MYLAPYTSMNVERCRDGSAKTHTNMDGRVQATQMTTQPYLHHFFIFVIRTKYKREKDKTRVGERRTWRGRDRRMSVTKKGGRGGICY